MKMFANVILVLLIATVSVQCYNAAELQNDELAVEGIIDQAKQLLEKLKKLTQDAIQKAIDKLKSLEDDLINKATKVKNDTDSTIHNKGTSFIDELNKIKKHAEELGIDITDCLKGREQDLINLPVKFGKNIVKCVTDKVAEGKAIVDDTIGKVNATYLTVLELAKELTNCGTDWSSAICIGGVIGKMTMEVANVPLQISSNVLQAVKLFSTLSMSMEKCALDNVIVMGEDGMKILQAIDTCVKNKIPHDN